MSLQRQKISGCLQFNTTANTSANLFTFQPCGWCQLENRLQIKTLRSFSSKSNQAEQILGFAKSKDTSLRATHLESLHSQIWHRDQSIFKTSWRRIGRFSYRTLAWPTMHVRWWHVPWWKGSWWRNEFRR